MLRSTTQSALMAIGTAWFLAQVIKATVMKVKKRNSKWLHTFLWRTGGMPSSHSALVAALTTYVGFTEGVQSLIFAITLGFSAIVVRDSLGIRRIVGKMVVRLTALELKLNAEQEEEYQRLKEVRGHEPSEVVAGVGLGLTVGIIFGVVLR